MTISTGNAPVHIFEPQHSATDEDSVSRSLAMPNGCSSFESFISNKDRILVVINDQTRPLVNAVLKRLPLKGKELTTIISTGTHRAPSSEELAFLLDGNTPPYGGSVMIHNSRDPSSLKRLGQTARGTEVQVNSKVFDADGLVVIGSVEPHYFAGFTGGRKFLLPGLAGFNTIEMNHSLALDDKARILALEGNPVHEDFMDALRLFGRNDDIFSIQLVMNLEHRISFASSGHILNSFADAVQHALKTYVCRVHSKADILVAVAKPPLDLDLYQAAKAMENVKGALSDDGILVLVAQCKDGIGNRGFYDLLSSSDDLYSSLKEKYSFGGHKALRIKQLLQRARVFAVTELEPSILETISIKPFREAQSALNEALALKGGEATIFLVNDAGVTVPIPFES